MHDTRMYDAASDNANQDRVNAEAQAAGDIVFDNLNADDRQMLEDFRLLSPEQQEWFLAYLRALVTARRSSVK